jgi:hypothetical protein
MKDDIAALHAFQLCQRGCVERLAERVSVEFRDLIEPMTTAPGKCRLRRTPCASERNAVARPSRTERPYDLRRMDAIRQSKPLDQLSAVAVDASTMSGRSMATQCSEQSMPVDVFDLPPAASVSRANSKQARCAPGRVAARYGRHRDTWLKVWSMPMVIPRRT